MPPRCLLLALPVAAACGAPSSDRRAADPSPAVEAPPPPRPSPIGDVVLRNAEYPLLGGLARLADGRYSGSLDAKALATRYEVALQRIRGDAWGPDGRPWVAVALQASAGERDRMFAALVTQERGRSRVAAVAPLPDGSEVRRFRFSTAADTLVVELLVPGAGDKRGFPSSPGTKRFAIVADTLAPVP